LVSLAFAPDGKTLASNGFGQAKIWDVATGKTKGLVGARPHPLGVPFPVAFAPHRPVVAIGCKDPSGALVSLVDVNSGKERETGRVDGDVWHLAFSRDGAKLAVVVNMKTVKLWDVSWPD
jgi:WD40 repeat protein